MTKPEPTTRLNIIDAFNRLFSEIDPSTDEEIDEIIGSVGIEPHSYAMKIEDLAQRTIRETGRNQLETARKNYISATPVRPKGRQDIIERIQKKLMQLDDQSRPAFANYRNLESASDSDLEGLLNDLSFLIGNDDIQGQE